jgi:hypothetical protein
MENNAFRAEANPRLMRVIPLLGASYKDGVDRKQEEIRNLSVLLNKLYC